MCLLAIAWKVHPDYPLALCANRDEFVARPTRRAHFWIDDPDIFAGRDLQGGGSWMGISRKGRLAAVTNIRDPAASRADARSRGLLVSHYLQDDIPALDYCLSLQAESGQYNGYNFIAFDGQALVYQSNHTDQPELLAPGIYAISNATLDTPWPKTLSAAGKMRDWLENPGPVDRLAQLLSDRSLADDNTLPQTGVSLEIERMLSAEFISSADYATRCSTALLLHRSGRAEFHEISHDAEAAVSRVAMQKFLQRR